MHESVVSQEEDAAKIVNGKRHAGSGSIKGFKSDASSQDWQIECKQTQKDSIAIKKEWLQKIKNEAMNQQKHPMLHIRFSNERSAENWIMIPEYVFIQLKDRSSS